MKGIITDLYTLIDALEYSRKQTIEARTIPDLTMTDEAYFSGRANEMTVHIDQLKTLLRKWEDEISSVPS